MRKLAFVLAVAALWSTAGAAADFPNKPANIVFRDAKIICPVVLRNVVKKGNGRQGVADVLTFAVARKYSRSDTKTLLRLCNLYAQSGAF